ncbi:MAG: hypothetical protein QXF12_01055 [Candidatus Aenigmatarchaeota archaeon]
MKPLEKIVLGNEISRFFARQDNYYTFSVHPMNNIHGIIGAFLEISSLISKRITNQDKMLFKLSEYYTQLEKYSLGVLLINQIISRVHKNKRFIHIPINLEQIVQDNLLHLSFQEELKETVLYSYNLFKSCYKYALNSYKIVMKRLSRNYVDPAEFAEQVDLDENIEQKIFDLRLKIWSKFGSKISKNQMIESTVRAQAVIPFMYAARRLGDFNEFQYWRDYYQGFILHDYLYLYAILNSSIYYDRKNDIVFVAPSPEALLPALDDNYNVIYALSNFTESMLTEYQSIFHEVMGKSISGLDIIFGDRLQFELYTKENQLLANNTLELLEESDDESKKDFHKLIMIWARHINLSVIHDIADKIHGMLEIISTIKQN